MEITEQDIGLVHEMVRDMAIEQFSQFGESPPFFAAIGNKEPKKLEELTNIGGLPLKMERLTAGNGPVLIGFYLASVPTQLWHGIMSAVAADIDATALVFTSATWIGVFPDNNGEGEQSAKEWYENHSDLNEFPDKKKAVVLHVHHRDKPSTLEVALIDDDTKKLGAFTVEEGREAKGDIKW